MTLQILAGFFNKPKENTKTIKVDLSYVDTIEQKTKLTKKEINTFDIYPIIACLVVYQKGKKTTTIVVPVNKVEMTKKAFNNKGKIETFFVDTNNQFMDAKLAAVIQERIINILKLCVDKTIVKQKYRAPLDAYTYREDVHKIALQILNVK